MTDLRHDLKLEVTISDPSWTELSPSEIESLVEWTLASEAGAGRTGGLAVIFVDDATISELHRKFMGDPTPTDVITFPADDAESWGELYISRETAARQAPAWNRDIRLECYEYVVHGLLHLLGYDDLDPHARARMHERQREILVCSAESVGCEPPDSTLNPGARREADE